MDTYAATYTDANGTEHITISNDGRTLCTVIRGVAFSGTDFDSFEPSADTPSADLAQFAVSGTGICACTISVNMPIGIVDAEGESTGALSVTLLLGDPRPDGGIDKEELSITLDSRYGRFSGSGKLGWFENELLEIQAQLLSSVYMRACINCLYSDYSPYGNGLFGCMRCFRNIKAEYLNVNSKDEFWTVHDRFEQHVQETYVCDEFERRIPGTGYRG